MTNAMLFLGGPAHWQKIDVPDDAEFFRYPVPAPDDDPTSATGKLVYFEYRRVEFFHPSTFVMIPLDMEAPLAAGLYYEWVQEQARTYLNKI